MHTNNILARDRWPRHPFCSNDKTASLVRNFSSALKYDYIQANPPCLCVWMIFDVDRDRGRAAEAGALAWQDADLPEPTWSCQNPKNGNAHLCWGFRVPVLTDAPAARIKPIRLLASLEAAYRTKLNADPAYGGLITKNPVSPRWRTFYGRRMDYELGELADYVDLPKHAPKRKIEEIGIGRNVTLFEWLRQLVYRDVRLWKSHGDRDRWTEYLNQQAIKHNSSFHAPLQPSECFGIAKSVSRWTWARFEVKEWTNDARWRGKQAYRGRLGGKAKKAAYADKRIDAQRMADTGTTQTAIAAALGVTDRTVRNWLYGGTGK